MSRLLRDIAHARAGDKGTAVLVTVIPFDPSDYPVLTGQVTADRIARRLGPRAVSVQRREMPDLPALIFRVERHPGDSVTSSLMLDGHGKSFGDVVLDLEVDEVSAVESTVGAADQQVVAVEQGELRGKALEGKGVRLFAGIPFAEPPVGTRRFRPPAPPRPWSGVRDATQFSPAPIQPSAGPLSISEDCLYLNVWTPDTAGPHPVVVWIYGGGFEGGSGSPPYFNGARLAARGLVVAAPNYRVGALGFAHLAGVGGEEWADSTNLGHQDQVAALHWVRSNIAAFGGDAANVTLIGLSAGGFSIGTILAMPGGGDLGDRVLMGSGATSRVYEPDAATALVRALMDAVGVATVEQLQQVPAEDLLAAQSVGDQEIGQRNLPGGRAWGTVLDGHILPVHPQESVEKGAAARIPMIVGFTADELNAWLLPAEAAEDPTTHPGFRVPATESDLLSEMERCVGAAAGKLLAQYRERYPEASLGRLRARFLGDWIYIDPAQRCAAAQTAAGGRAWLYRFSWGIPTLGGAVHGADFPFLFDCLDAFGITDDSAATLRDEVISSLVAFARTGDPGWPQYQPGEQSTLKDFGAP